MKLAVRPGAWKAGEEPQCGVLREMEAGKGSDLRGKDLSDALTGHWLVGSRQTSGVKGRHWRPQRRYSWLI